MNVSEAWFGQNGQPGDNGWHLWVKAVAGTGGTTTEPGGAPAQLALAAAYPNPFAEAAALPFELPEAGAARLAGYDVLRREVAWLVDGALPPGAHTARLEGGPSPAGPTSSGSKWTGRSRPVAFLSQGNYYQLIIDPSPTGPGSGIVVGDGGVRRAAAE